jgi:hypothetical protein
VHQFAVDDLYLHNNMLGFAHEQKAHGQQWVWLIGVATKTVFAILMGLTK